MSMTMPCNFCQNHTRVRDLLYTNVLNSFAINSIENQSWPSFQKLTSRPTRNQTEVVCFELIQVFSGPGNPRKLCSHFIAVHLNKFHFKQSISVLSLKWTGKFLQGRNRPVELSYKPTCCIACASKCKVRFPMTVC